MCPPAQPFHLSAEIDQYWSDDQIILFLDDFSRGARLPSNVLEDSSPYQYPPAFLPEGFWFLVQSSEKKESDFGFWKANIEACRIYSDPMISGWRTTLQYFEGQNPRGKRTEWFMQEYNITREELFDKNKIKESRSLCRVFLCGGNTSKYSEMYTVDCEPLVEPKQKYSSASNIAISSLDPKSEAKENDCEEKLLSVTDKEPKSSHKVFSQQECFSRGDFLELNDLEEDPESQSSSSQNSSCPSKLSDEYFDSLALLRDLEEEDNKYMEEKQSSSRYDFTPSILPNDMVMHPPSSGTLAVHNSQTCSTDHERLTDGKELDHSMKRPKPGSPTAGTSNSSNGAISPTTHKDIMPNGEKKTSSSVRMKKLKMYFCLTLSESSFVIRS